ncbi:MAG: GIY-YIG nuclease family protein [Gemmataceae bacterium]|nr:GIY-YIG nuclease family protein [Gemmataceae bacterium]
MASFIGHTPGLAFFVGLYEVRGYKTVSHEQLLRMPAQKELLKLGMGSVGDRESQCFFDLELLKHYADWRGKLIVRWPPPGIAWARWAQDNAFPIHAILDEPIFDGKLPDWRSLVFTWAELAVMPTKWQAILAQTRGIYYIFDEQDGKGYVGSACGADNILGRWLNYSKSGHGGNKRLRKCDPGNLRFSILEVVPSDMESKEVIGREVMWKVRLHTRKFGLNEN